MSNEPLYSERQPSEPAGVTPSADSTFDADAEIVLAALGRMEAAIRDDRATLARLRTALSETASVISEAKRALHAGAIKPDAATEGKDFGALLDDLEHRIDTALEFAGIRRHASPAGAASEPAVPSDDPERVPTVSGVVSRLNRGSETEPADQPQGGDVTGLPTVSMLQAMVEALHVEAAPQQADTENQASETGENQQVQEPTAFDPAPAEPLEPVHPVMQANPIPPESELLASVAQLQALPMMPPEVGAAVIFARVEPQPWSPEPSMPVVTEPPQAVVPERLDQSVADVVGSVSAGTASLTEMPAEPAEADQEGDLDAFLFGPEADQAEKPSAAGPPIESVALPTLDLITPSHFATATAEQALPEPTPAEAPPTEAMTSASAVSETIERTPEPDPLAPLKAMTANERLALFT